MILHAKFDQHKKVRDIVITLEAPVQLHPRPIVRLRRLTEPSLEYCSCASKHDRRVKAVIQSVSMRFRLPLGSGSTNGTGLKNSDPLCHRSLHAL